MITRHCISFDTDKAKRFTAAYHEAGHAVAAHLFGIAFTAVTICPEHDSLGACIFSRVYTRLDNWVITLLAGCYAQQYSPYHHVSRYVVPRGDSNDREQAMLAVIKHFPEWPDYADFLVQCEHKTEELFRRPRIKNAVKSVALALLRCETLTPEETNGLIQKAIKR